MIKAVLQFITVYLYSLGSALYLFTLGGFSVRNRDFIRQIACYFGFDSRILQFRIIDISKIIPDDTPILLKETAQRDGNVTLQELFALNVLVKKYNPKTIFEIGTFNGRTTLNLAANSSQEAVVYTLDLPLQQLEHIAHKLRIGDRKYAKKTICGELYLNSPYANKIKQLYGDSARFDFSPYFNNIDMVFVDGAHSYDYVVNDSEIALKLIGSKKGIIVWHDSILNEIADAIHYVLGKNQLKGSCSLIKGTTIAFALIELHNSYL